MKASPKPEKEQLFGKYSAVDGLLKPVFIRLTLLPIIPSFRYSND